MQHVPGLYVGESHIHGRGVFCAHPLQDGDVIEICPVIRLPRGEKQWLDKSELFNYYWLWGEDRTVPAIVLGFGSIYNHCEVPNATSEALSLHDILLVKAVEDIPANTEITIDYSGGLNKGQELWFTPENST